MLRKFAAALIAATMFTAPVLAQGTAPAKPAQTTQAPATPTPAAKAAVANAAKVKTVKIKKHHVKNVKKDKIVKHIKKHRHVVRCYGPRKHPKTAMTAPVLRTTAKVVPARTN